MSNWSVALTDQDGTPVLTPLQVRPETLKWGEGGPVMALLPVMGDLELRWEIRGWLGYSVTVYNPLGAPVWWGKVVEARIAQGVLQFVYSLTNMYNRVAVAYTTGIERGTTDWEEDARSIARYGRKELLFTRSDMSLAQAEAERDRILADTAWPVPEVRGGGGATMLHCIGDWQTLGWVRYADDSGRLVFDEATETVDQMCGWELSGSDIGFTRDGNVHSGSGKFDDLVNGGTIEITGPTNAGTYTIDGSASDQVIKTYTATTISFEVEDDIEDSADGLGFIQSGTLINISGSSNNSGWHLCKTQKGPDRIEISKGYSANIVAESAGPSVSISTSQSIPVAETLTDEAPGTSTTITAHGERTAQSFQIAGTEAYTLAEVVIRAKKVGNPSDYLKVELYSDSSGNPGSSLDSATVIGDDLTTIMSDVSFVLANTQSLAASTTYHIVVSRSGSNDDEDFYLIELDEGQNYSDGSVKLYDGSSWSTRSPGADMPFELWGHLDTGEQMERIALDFDSLRDTFTRISVRVTTGIESRQYRDGDNTALSELRALLAGGTSSGERLRAIVSNEGALVIDTAPTSDEIDAIWQANGVLTDINGQRLPPGVLPYQQWVRIAGAPTTEQDVAAPSPVFFEAIELNVPSGRIMPTTAGGTDVWSLSGFQQG